MTIIPIVIGALGTVTKELVQRLKDMEITGWVETVQTTTLLRSARILKRDLEISHSVQVMIYDCILSVCKSLKSP